MRLVHGEYYLNLELEENLTNVIVVENGRVLYQLMHELYLQSQGEDGHFVLSRENEILKLSRSMAVVLEPFTLNCNEKQLINKLYKELEKLGKNELAKETSQIHTEFVKYIDKLCMRVPYPIMYNLDFETKDLLKLFEVRMEEQKESILDKLIEYLQVLKQLCNVDVISFLNLKSFLTKSELEGLYEYAFYCKIQLVLWENIMRQKLDQERVTIIDQDCCIIHC